MHNLFIFTIFCLFIAINDKGFGSAKNPKERPRTQLRIDDFGEGNAVKFRGGCSFYCFFIPENKNERITLHFARNLSCSHMTYGWALVTDDAFLFPTKKDLIPFNYFGNFKIITGLRDPPIAMKVLLGITRSPSSNFLNNEESSRNVTKRIIFYTRRFGFDGVFVKFDFDKLMHPHFQRFIQVLNSTIEEDSIRYKNLDRLKIVLSISSKFVPNIQKRMLFFDKYIDAFYLWSNETKLSVSDPQTKRVIMDALSVTKDVGKSETIIENAEQLASSGIQRKKIIIGLSAWARSYSNSSESNSINKQILTKKEVPYQELCKVLDNKSPNYDKQTRTTSFTSEDGTWYSFNYPRHESMKSKLDWISGRGYGGFGLFSVQGDDLQGQCKDGLLPLHRSVADVFECSIQRLKRGFQNQTCVRLCHLNLDRNVSETEFTFQKMDPMLCSHVVIGSVDIFSIQKLQPTKGFDRALKLYNSWNSEHKPYLILSIGGPEQGSDIWRMAVFLNTALRLSFAEEISKLVKITNADGVEINWTFGKMISFDKISFTNFIKELRHQLSSRQIIISMSAQNVPAHSHESAYDFKELSGYADYFLLNGYTFHKPISMHTGHHSPLFLNQTLLTQPRLTIEGMSADLIAQGLPIDKFIVGLSTIALSMTFLSKNVEPKDRKIGDLATNTNLIKLYSRSGDSGLLTQSDICNLQNNSKVVNRFLDEIGVPYLINDQEFIAYDSIKSIAIKTVWISINNFAGIALHGLEGDDIDGKCSDGKPFRLLRAIAETQICTKCSPKKQSRKLEEMKPKLFPATLKSPPASFEMIISKKDRNNGNKTKPESENNCRQQNGLIVSCVYELPRKVGDDQMEPETIPFDKCDELVLEDTLINEKIELVFSGSLESENYVQKIISKFKSKPIITVVRCRDIKVKEFKELMNEKRPDLISAIREHVESHKFSGVEFRCDHLLTPEVKDDFTTFLKELQSEFTNIPIDDNVSGSLCHKTISLRLPVWRWNLKECYDIETLKSLHRIVMGSSHLTLLNQNQTQLLNPLFAVDMAKKYENHIQSTTLNAWLEAGIDSRQIILLIPAYGIKQILTQEIIKEPIKPGDPAGKQIAIISHRKVCEFIRSTRKHMLYDQLSEYATTAHDWISFEGRATAAYKVKYAAKKFLGGVALNKINDEDLLGVCHHGEFPLLTSMYKAKCQSL